MLFTPPNAVMCDGRRSRSRRRSGCGSKERQRARERKRPREEKHHLVFSHAPKVPTLSKNNTPTPRILLLIHTQQRGPSRRLKDIINAITRQTTALEILSRANHLLHIRALFCRREPQTLLPHLLLGQRIVSEILLESDEDNGHRGTAFARLFRPLVLDVIEGVGRVDAEADEDDVRFGVGEGAQALVVFLAGGIPEGELHGFAVYSTVGDVVFEDGWNVALSKLEKEDTLQRPVTCLGILQLESNRE